MSEHHQFGTIVGDEETSEGFFAIDDSLLLSDVGTLSVAAARDGVETPMIALALSGRVNKGEDTVGTVWALDPEHAGTIAGHLIAATVRLGNRQAIMDMQDAMKAAVEAGEEK